MCWMLNNSFTKPPHFGFIQGQRRTVQSRCRWGESLGHSFYPSNPILPSDPQWVRGGWSVLQPAQSTAMGERWGAWRTFNHFPCSLCQHQLSHFETGLPWWVDDTTQQHVQGCKPVLNDSCGFVFQTGLVAASKSWRSGGKSLLLIRFHIWYVCLYLFI